MRWMRWFSSRVDNYPLICVKRSRRRTGARYPQRGAGGAGETGGCDPSLQMARARAAA